MVNKVPPEPKFSITQSENIGIELLSKYDNGYIVLNAPVKSVCARYHFVMSESVLFNSTLYARHTQPRGKIIYFEITRGALQDLSISQCQEGPPQ